MPRLNTNYKTTLTETLLSTSVEIPGIIANKDKGLSCQEVWIQKGQRVLIETQNNSTSSFFLGVMDDDRKNQQRHININNKIYKINAANIFSIKTSKQNLNTAKKLTPIKPKTIAWNENLAVRVAGKNKNLDKTLTTNRSLHGYLKSQKAYQPEEWCYTQSFPESIKDDIVLPYALTMRKMSSKDILELYASEKEYVKSVNPQELTDEGFDTYETLLKVIKAFELEIQRRGFDNKTAAEKAFFD